MFEFALKEYGDVDIVVRLLLLLLLSSFRIYLGSQRRGWRTGGWFDFRQGREASQTVPDMFEREPHGISLQ